MAKSGRPHDAGHGLKWLCLGYKVTISLDPAPESHRTAGGENMTPFGKRSLESNYTSSYFAAALIVQVVTSMVNYFIYIMQLV